MLSQCQLAFTTTLQFSYARPGFSWCVLAALQDHLVALDDFKLRIAEAGLQLPPALLCNGDVDATLLRFLRARKYNVDHAMAMLESE